MTVNKALYYGQKLNNPLINPNQFRCYGMMVWDNHFDPNRDLCLDKCEWNTIDIIPEGTKIGFSSHIPTEEELRNLPHTEVKYGSKWNPSTVKLGKVYIDNYINAFHSKQHTFGYNTI